MSQLILPFVSLLQRRARNIKLKKAANETDAEAQERFDSLKIIGQIHQDADVVWIYTGMQSTAFDINLNSQSCFYLKMLRKDQLAKLGL